MGNLTYTLMATIVLYFVMSMQVNGMDILAVREATKWCADYIRSGKVV